MKDEGCGTQDDQAAGCADRTRRLIWVVIPVLALGIRLLYLHQIRGIPFFETPAGDAARYDGWGADIAAGNWLGHETFYQAPAYPYLIGVIYWIVGRSLMAVRLVQALFGAISCLFVALAGEKFISRHAGMIAGLLLAFYPPAIFFDGLLQKTSLALLLWSALLWRLGAIYKKGHCPGVTRPLPGGRTDRGLSVGFLLVGLVLGALTLTRENALVLVMVIIGWPAIGFRTFAVKKRAAWAAWFLLGCALILGPVAIRNRVVGGEWALTTVQAGPNFYIGNHQGASGRYTPLVAGHESPPFERNDAKRLAEEAAGQALSDRAVSHYWLGQAWAYIISHPADWLRLLGKKTLMTLNAYEISDVEGFSVYRVYSPMLNILAAFWHFGMLVPLAAAGLVFCRREGRRVRLLLAIGIVMGLSVVAFYVLARYRFPLVPVAAILAGAGAAGVCDSVRSQAYRRLVTPIVMALVAAVVCNWPVNPVQKLDGMALGNLGTVLAREGRLPEAAAAFEAAADINPGSAEAQYNLGLALRLTGEPHRAIEHLSAAKRLSPKLVEVDFQLGQLYEAIGDKHQALECYREAVRIDPDDDDSRDAIERLSSGE